MPQSQEPICYNDAVESCACRNFRFPQNPWFLNRSQTSICKSPPASRTDPPTTKIAGAPCVQRVNIARRVAEFLRLAAQLIRVSPLESALTNVYENKQLQTQQNPHLRETRGVPRLLSPTRNPSILLHPKRKARRPKPTRPKQF